MFTAIVVITHVINLRQCDIYYRQRKVWTIRTSKKKKGLKCDYWFRIENRQIRINYNNQEKSLDVKPAYKTVI